MVKQVRKLAFVSSNTRKLEAVQLHLDVTVDWVRLDLPEVQSLSVETVVVEKARTAYSKLRCPVLVEDFAVQFNGLNGFPGPLIKWMTTALSPTEICRLLDGKDRSATVECAFAFLLESGQDPTVVRTSIEGHITHEPASTQTYPVESIFVPQGAAVTWAEMSPTESATFSVRPRACQLVAGELRKRLAVE